jgi:RimJ/RimL family protein N-acetyltransferase
MSEPPCVAIRACLLPIQPQDLAALFEQQSDPQACRLAAVKPRERAAFMTHWSKVLSDPDVIARGIWIDDLLAGNISCFQRGSAYRDLSQPDPPAPHTPARQHYVGYWLGRRHWGRGIATRALTLFLTEVRIRPLHSRVARDNVASLRVLQKCGFIITGYESSDETDRYLACEEALLRLD